MGLEGCQRSYPDYLRLRKPMGLSIMDGPNLVIGVNNESNHFTADERQH
jgi:hypothetical protein